MSSLITLCSCIFSSYFICNCKYANGQPCYTMFPAEDIVRRRLDMASITPREYLNKIANLNVKLRFPSLGF